ncbi:flagellar hook-associated protein 2 [Paenibacillus anaericanus]|uniref:flagellar filament capping protein FliD n=1 Tax=Paenibacillus anaericanus TaxID=170367 RepID=UPI00277F47FC|nr:flagellar filament capping protein FliD [Paenibacillus anaericanus]MDQ0089890.1 flagellar hook-associated protein 2 [Paenibacillus anaericanus]
MSISLTGMASGLNTAEMVEKLMALERKSYENLELKQTYMKDVKSFYTGINTKLSALRNAASDLMLRANYQLTSAKSSNESVAQISAGTSVSTGSFLVEVRQLATPHVMMWDTATPDTDFAGGEVTKTIKFHFEGKEIEIEAKGKNAGELMESIKTQVNSKAKGLTAAVINTSTGKKLIFNASNPGSDGKIGFTSTEKGVYIEDTEGAFSLLGTNTQVAPEEAIFKVNGVEITQGSNVMTNIIDGVTVNLTGTGSSTVKVNTDTDKIASKVEAFIKAYNDVITSIRDVIGEKKPLQGDSTLRDLSNQMNQWMNTLVDFGDGTDFNKKYTLASFGLEIDKGQTKASLMTGTIGFDKEKFINKFLEDPELVISMFNKTVPDLNNPDNPDKLPKAVGIAALFKDNIYAWSKSDGVFASKIKGYDAEVALITDQMSRLDAKLQAKEARMKSQFTAMEVALTKLQSEQNYMAGQLNALTKK